MPDIDEMTESYEAYTELVDAMSRLSVYFKKGVSEVRYLANMPIPMKSTDQGDMFTKGEDLDRYRISSETTHPSEGLADALNALTRLQYYDGQDRKSTIRMPGLVVVPDEAIKVAMDINAKKSRFNMLIQTSTSHQEKQAIRSEFKCSFLQAYRSIVIIDDPVELVTFSWAKGNQSIERITIGELRARIDRYYVGEPDTDSAAKVEGGIVNSSGMMNAIQGLNDSEIVALKREVKPHIKANHKPVDGKWRAHDGSIPILVSESAARTLKGIEPLSRETTVRRKRASIFEPEPIIEKLNCYRYLEPEYAK